MMPKATVLVPTHDHGPTIIRAINSILSQTVQDSEVFVIGDGVPDVTRELMAELVQRDRRVRFFDHPKGPRHGEIYRHQALAEARGEIVCYLSDDDLYLPNHIEVMQRLLADYDFANALPLFVQPDDELSSYAVDLSLPFYREKFRAPIPLSAAAHTLAMYRRLPYGWRTTPPGLATDRYMWQQFFDLADCRPVSHTRPTYIGFPQPLRSAWSIEQRCQELDRWCERIADPAWNDRLLATVLDTVVCDRARDMVTFYATDAMRLVGLLRKIPGMERAARFAARFLKKPSAR